MSPQRHRPHSDSFIKTKVKMTVLSQRVCDLTNCHQTLPRECNVSKCCYSLKQCFPFFRYKILVNIHTKKSPTEIRSQYELELINHNNIFKLQQKKRQQVEPRVITAEIHAVQQEQQRQHLFLLQKLEQKKLSMMSDLSGHLRMESRDNISIAYPFTPLVLAFKPRKWKQNQESIQCFRITEDSCYLAWSRSSADLAASTWSILSHSTNL